MSTIHLQEMGLDVERVAAAVDFLEAYADSVAIAQSEDADAQWISTVDSASALREAAQWALCFAPMRARDLLRRAGDLFLAVGQPFGGFLHVVSGSWFYEPAYEQLGSQLRTLERLSFPERDSVFQDVTEVPASAPLRHPQQQAYLMLASASIPSLADEFQSPLRRLLTESPQRVGVAPVGALGTPIRRFWRIATQLFEARDGSASAIVEDLLTLARGYAESMDLARTNDYLWQNAAAPVDVGDIDIIGIMVAAYRRLGVDRVLSALAERAETTSFVARAPLEMAIEFVQSEQ